MSFLLNLWNKTPAPVTAHVPSPQQVENGEEKTSVAQIAPPATQETVTIVEKNSTMDQSLFTKAVSLCDNANQESAKLIYLREELVKFQEAQNAFLQSGEVYAENRKKLEATLVLLHEQVDSLAALIFKNIQNKEDMDERYKQNEKLLEAKKKEIEAQIVSDAQASEAALASVVEARNNLKQEFTSLNKKSEKLDELMNK